MKSGRPNVARLQEAERPLLFSSLSHRLPLTFGARIFSGTSEIRDSIWSAGLFPAFEWFLAHKSGGKPRTPNASWNTVVTDDYSFWFFSIGNSHKLTPRLSGAFFWEATMTDNPGTGFIPEIREISRPRLTKLLQTLYAQGTPDAPGRV